MIAERVGRTEYQILSTLSIESSYWFKFIVCLDSYQNLHAICQDVNITKQGNTGWALEKEVGWQIDVKRARVNGRQDYSLLFIKKYKSL